MSGATREEPTPDTRIRVDHDAVYVGPSSIRVVQHPTSVDVSSFLEHQGADDFSPRHPVGHQATAIGAHQDPETQKGVVHGGGSCPPL